MTRREPGCTGDSMPPARPRCPTQAASTKCLYLVTRSLDPTGRGRARWAMRWKPALNAFAITFGDRFSAAETY
jgi:putative transposase